MTTVMKGKYPSKEECLVLLKKYGTPERVIKHCIKVAQVAEAVASELSRCGLNLDIPLVISSAYLHDIAKIHSKHDRVGAEYLVLIGMDDVAEVIENHTFRNIEHSVDQIDEKDVLCIADRMVLEDRYVGPEKRMEYIIGNAVKKFGENKREELEKKASEFVQYVQKIETFIDKKIEDIL